MDNVMDLSAFQLVGAMNDMDVMRLSNEQQQQQQQSQRQQQTQQANQHQLQQKIQDDIDLLLNPSNTNTYLSYTGSNNMDSPHYRTTPSSGPQNECYDQHEDIFTPLMSPAITPSFSYRVQPHAKDAEFPPLSSPAILPQVDGNNYQKRSTFQQTIDSTSSNDNPDYENLSASQIREQYEQLERAKMLITQKLSQLQKTKMQYQSDINYYPASSNQSNSPNLLPQQNHPSTGSSNSTITTKNSTSLSKPTSPSQSPHIEPATPASLMNMRISSLPSKLQFSTKNASHNKKPIFQSPSVHDSPSGAPVASMPSPLTLQPRNKEKTTPRANKKQRRDTTTSESKSGMHSSPRALKPLLISPTLHPGNPPTNGIVSTVEDAEHILATRSNYQNLMEGKGAALGIAFQTQIKSGIEVRRTAHKAAEQKRRDSLKEWFDRLRREVEEGYVKRQKSLMSQVMEAQQEEGESGDATMKPLSKVLLLQYAYEYITSLKSTLEEKENTIKTLMRDEKKRKQEEDGSDIESQI